MYYVHDNVKLNVIYKIEILSFDIGICKYLYLFEFNSHNVTNLLLIIKYLFIMKPIITLAKNQYSIETDGKITFQSYETIVCTIENYENGNKPVIKITENQPQSKTTAKYLNQFLQLHTGITNYKNI